MQTVSEQPALVDRRNEGEERKDVAHALFSVHRDRLIRHGQRVLIETILAHGRATADDVRDQLDIPAGINPKFVGAIPGPLAKANIIAADGFEKSRRAVAHARPNHVWRLRDDAKARQWLAMHPELPDPESAGGSAVSA